MAWNDDLPTPVGPDGSPVYFDRTYRETMTLLVETRDYMRFREPADRGAMPDDHRLAVNCEALRVTSRLTHIMAWLLIQKAVHAGEMTAAEAAAADHRLAGQSVCRERVVAGGVAMPPMLEHLLERSYQLYARVERLDALVARATH
jgi:regulator of CtrA degradation